MPKKENKDMISIYKYIEEKENKDNLNFLHLIWDEASPFMICHADTV